MKTKIQFVVEAYRSGDLSRGQVAEMLGLSFYETEALLKAHNCDQGLSIEDFKREASEARAFLGW